MRRSRNRIVGAVIGVVLVASGVAGFASGGGFVETHGPLALGLFRTNGLQSLVHVLLGAVIGAAAAVSPRAARTVNSIGGTLLLALGIAGLFLAGTTADVLSLNSGSNVLHFAAAVLLLAAGFGAPPSSERASHADRAAARHEADDARREQQGSARRVP